MLRIVDNIQLGRIGRKFLTRISAICCFRSRETDDILIALGTRSTIAIINYSKGKKIWEKNDFNTFADTFYTVKHISSLNCIIAAEGGGITLIHLDEDFRVEQDILDSLRCGQKHGLVICNDEKAIIATSSWKYRYQIRLFDLRLRKEVERFTTENHHNRLRLFSEPVHQPNRIIVTSVLDNPETWILDTKNMTILKKFNFCVYSFTIDSLRPDIGVFGDEDGMICVGRFPSESISQKQEETEENEDEEDDEYKIKYIKPDQMKGKYISYDNICSTDRFKVFFSYSGYVLGQNFKHFLIETSFLDEKKGEAVWKHVSFRNKNRIESETAGILLDEYDSMSRGKYIFSVSLLRQKITITRFENTKSSRERMDENERIEFLSFFVLYKEDDNDEEEEGVVFPDFMYQKIQMYLTVPFFVFKSFLSFE